MNYFILTTQIVGEDEVYIYEIFFVLSTATRNGVNVCNGDKECCRWFGIKLFLWFLQQEVDLRFKAMYK